MGSVGERTLGREGDIVTVNGQLGATVVARPGERERWRIVNACSSRYLRLRLDGQRMQLLGIDAGRYASLATAMKSFSRPATAPTSW